MCGLAGSPQLITAFDLYQRNLDRGNFGSGFLAVGKEHFLCLKKEGTFELEDLEKECKSIQPWYYLFHSRAPTNTDKQWSYDTSHPFFFENWGVAHNGIISNVNYFKEEIKVDTQLIPLHLAREGGKINKVYEKYQGLLTSWLFDSSGNALYLVKAGSALYLNSENQSFSSSSFNGAVSVEDGSIYHYLNQEVWTFSKKFLYLNPYAY